MKQFFQTLPWKLARLEFYKKKPFAVTCTVIISVLLAFDLVIAVFVPSTNSIAGMQGFSASDMQEIMDSTEFDRSDLPGGASGSDADGSSDNDSDSSSGSSDSDGDSSGSMPSGDMPDISSGDFSGDMGDMPGGDSSGNMGDMPSGDGSGDMSGFPGGSDSGSGSDSDSSSGSSTDGSSDAGLDSNSDASASDGSDSASVGDTTSGAGKSATRGSGIMGFLRGVKSYWILLAVLFGILDVLSITRLVILARRAKKERIEEAKQVHEQMLAGEIVRQAAPEKKHKKTNPAAVWAIPMVGVLLLVAIVNGLSAGAAATVESTSASVYSGTAETISLDTVVSGAGTLEEEDAESLELNSTVEISTWYVSNGDTVAEGDRLAAVDKVSVMSAIASLQEQMDELDAQLAEYETEEIDDTITAASDGRVMAIYAEEDTSVVDTMYDYGSLLLLSIDGYLTVDLETEEELQAGDSVTVILSDDTEVTGKVGSYLDGTAVILVSDEDASLGEEVSVETEDGDEIGSGALYIHSQLAVTGYLGTVYEISVEVGDEVESGDTLLTLTDTEYAGTYETLLAQRSELEEEMQELFTLYQDPYLYASCAGVVSGIDDDTSSDSSSSDDSDSSSSDDSDDSSASVADDNTVLASAATENSVATATAMACTVSSGNTSGSTTATASTLTASSDTSGTAVTTSTSDGYDNYIGIVQSVDDDSATATVLFLTGVYEITDYSDLSDYDLSTDNMTESHTIDMSTGTIMFTYSSSGLTLGTAADIATGDILVISYESGGSPGLGSTPVWIVRVVEDSSEDESGDTDSSTSGSDSESNSTDSRSDSSGTSGSSGSDSSSGSSSGSDTSDSPSSGSGGSSSISGSDSTSGSSGSGSGSDSASGNFGTASGSDTGNASGSSGTGSVGDSGNASGSSDYSTLESGMDSDSSGSLGSGNSDSQGSTDGSTDLDSFAGSTDGSESSDTNIILDGTSSSTDLESLYSDSTSDSASSTTDAGSGSSSYSLDTSSATDSTLTDSATDAAGETDASANGSTVTSAYTVSKTTLLDITPQDSMTITITIDELDILSLEEGQTAQVTLDAFPGQAFEGEVTAIDLSGTNSGGSTKFTAEVTIAREDDMLVGMNASAVITIDTTEDVLCIPEDALVETDGVCYVYTTYDEKNEELGGLVEVTTGLSDGENVEILSGLGEGESYYYSILDVVNYSTFSASSGGGFSMDSLFSSGGMGGR